jgi:hypothetical protein
VAAAYSLPLQNNIVGGIGPKNSTVNILNVQPVLPFTFGNWNLISRTIAPVIYTPDLVGGLPEFASVPSGRGSAFGLGDINETLYLSPSKSGALIWSAGPSINISTATSRQLGSGRLSLGPSAVVLAMPKPLVLGLLARQLWSVAGDGNRSDVTQLLLQPFVNYNLSGGWYLATSPVVTANWNAAGGKWSVPIGGGFGKVFSIGTQPMNAQIQAFDYVARARYGPKWAVRLQVQFLFPR